MLSQEIMDNFLNMKKRLLYDGVLSLPYKGQEISMDAVSLDDREFFIFDISRGKISIKKCKYQNRKDRNTIITRLDIVSNNSFHYNPDGEKITGPHLHYYREGAGLAWARRIDLETISSNGNLCDCLAWFFKYCNVINIPALEGRYDDNVSP